MKAFFTILLLAAIGGGYYFFVHQKKSIDDLMPAEKAPIASNGTPSSTPKPKPTAASPKSPAPEKAKSQPVTPSKPVEPAKSEIDLIVEKSYPMPQILPLNEITKNWSAVPPNAYPKEIMASEPVPFTLMINGVAAGATKTPPGTPLKPVQLVNDQLTVASLVNPAMTSVIPVDKTNFKQTIEARYNSFVTFKKNQIETVRAKAKAALQAQPDRLASLRNTGPGDPTDDPRFAAVKASIQRGDANPASLEEATSFKWNGSERIGGEMRGSYDTVSVHFEVKTIFGKFPTDYKCLLQGGKVVGWIDPLTEEKITRE